MKNPTHCDRCGGAFNGGYCARWVVPPGAKEAKLTEAICFDCEEVESVYQFNKDRVLTSRLMTSAVLNASHDEYRVKRGSRSYGEPERRYAAMYRLVYASYEKVRLEVKRFEQAVWFAGLQAQVQKATHRGFKMTFSDDGVDTIAMVYSLAARTQITIERGDTQIMLITAEDETSPVMGINGLRATEQQAIDLLKSAAGAFKSGAKFKRNDKVGIL